MQGCLYWEGLGFNLSANWLTPHDVQKQFVWGSLDLMGAQCHEHNSLLFLQELRYRDLLTSELQQKYVKYSPVQMHVMYIFVRRFCTCFV